MDAAVDRRSALLEEVQALVRAELGRGLAGSGLQRLEALLAPLTGNGGVPVGQRFTREESTVLFADLRGFSGFAAHHQAPLVLRTLNEYLVRMSDIVVANGGVIDKFLGDALMVRFGHTGAPLHAVTCAVRMQLAMREFNAAHAKHGDPTSYMGVGINTGPVMAGVLGPVFHQEYTVIGKNVNLASRIEAVSLRGQVLISESTWRKCHGKLVTRAPIALHVKGSAKPVVVREVVAIPSQDLVVPRCEHRTSPRADVDITARYHRIKGKAVDPIAHPAVLRDVGCSGVQIELNVSVPRLAEVKLEFELAPSLRAREVYAKVVRLNRRGRHWLAGLEFTSMDEHLETRLRRFVHLRLQEQFAAQA